MKINLYRILYDIYAEEFTQNYKPFAFQNNFEPGKLFRG